jgi:hypothetical protein
MAAAGRVTFLGLCTYHLHTYLSAGNMGAASKIMCRSMITPLRRRLHAAPTSRADEEADKPSSGRKLKSLPPNGRRTNPGERTPSTPGQRAAKRTSARGRRSNPGEGTPSTPSERAAKRTQASGHRPERRPNTNPANVLPNEPEPAIAKTTPREREPNEPEPTGAKRPRAVRMPNEPEPTGAEPERSPNTQARGPPDEPKWLAETMIASCTLVPAFPLSHPLERCAGGRFVDQCGAGAISPRARGIRCDANR